MAERLKSEKYRSSAKFLASRARRGAMRAAIAPLVRWENAPADRDGYTVIIGCNSRLAPMVGANLAMLERLDLEGVDAVIVVFDRPEAEVGGMTQAELKERFPRLPLRCLYYTARQARVAKLFDWGWIYSWMSWSLGIAATRTRYALLHDFDALPLRPDTLASRYHAIRAGNAEYLGIKHYVGSGLIPDDGLVTTFEMIFDAEFVRRTFRPIDLFNNVRRFQGRRVEFDTFLHAQTVAGRAAVLPIDEASMVHPSQMICQYVDHVNGRAVPAGTNNIFMIPYYFHLGGDPGPFRDVGEQLQRGSGGSVRVFGRPLDPSQLTPAHAAWYAKQAGRLERELFGEVRTEVRAYFEAIEAAVGATSAAAAE